MKALITSIGAWLCLCFGSGCKSDPMAKMPEFDFRMSDSTTIMSTRNIPDSIPVVMILFEADCSHCQETTDTLLQHINEIKNIRFYFLTVEPFDKVSLFRDHFHLDRYSNIVVGQDYGQNFPRFYKSRTTPLIAVYKPGKFLDGVYDGKPQMHELFQTLKNIQ